MKELDREAYELARLLKKGLWVIWMGFWTLVFIPFWIVVIAWETLVRFEDWLTGGRQ